MSSSISAFLSSSRLAFVISSCRSASSRAPFFQASKADVSAWLSTGPGKVFVQIRPAIFFIDRRAQTILQSTRLVAHTSRSCAERQAFSFPEMCRAAGKICAKHGGGNEKLHPSSARKSRGTSGHGVSISAAATSRSRLLRPVSCRRLRLIHNWRVGFRRTTFQHIQPVCRRMRWRSCVLIEASERVRGC